MKPVFCTDVTDNKHSAAIHGEEFIFATLSDDTRREINITMEEAAKPLKQAELPLPLRLLRYAGLCLAMVMGITMFSCTILLLGNFLADILYGFADPRIKVGKE